MASSDGKGQVLHGVEGRKRGGVKVKVMVDGGGGGGGGDRKGERKGRPCSLRQSAGLCAAHWPEALVKNKKKF